MSDNQQPLNEQVETPVPQKPKKSTSPNIFVMLSLVFVAIIAFTLGTRAQDVADMLGISIGTDSTLDLSSVETTYQTLLDKYDGKLDTQALIDGANRGLVEAAGDQYTVYMSKSEAEEFEKSLSGEIGGGIGAEIGMREGAVSIVRVLSGNPAEAAGLRAQDRVVSVNDESTIGWTVDQVVQAIRGKEGSTVRVGVMRSGESKEFEITRRLITAPNVETEIINSVGVIKLSRFDGDAASLTKQAARRFKEQGVKGVVLDMRGNGGGYLDAAQEIAGIWLNDKVVVTERVGGKTVEELKSGKSPILAGMPTVVLVNGGSASASEIVAGALKDNGAATIIGEQTFGKGSVQQLIDMPGGAQLKVTTARWFTPSGKNITESGIKPDKIVQYTREDNDKGEDPQLDASIRELQ